MVVDDGDENEDGDVETVVEDVQHQFLVMVP